jgi:hypothetical protein
MSKKQLKKTKKYVTVQSNLKKITIPRNYPWREGVWRCWGFFV